MGEGEPAQRRQGRELIVPTRTPRATQGPKVSTLRAVAEAAGCSMMTVSKVLNGVHVSPEYAARVRAAADALGYVPNVAAQSVRGARSRTVGLLFNMDFDPRSEVMSVVDHLVREMEGAGNQVLLSVARDGSALDAHLRGFLGRRVDGVFYWNVQPSRFLDLYEKAQIPVLGMAFGDPRCAHVPTVTVDVSTTFGEMYARLSALGHRVGVELTRGRMPALHEVFAAPGKVEWTTRDVGTDPRALVDFVQSLDGWRNDPTVVLADYPTAVGLLAACETLAVDVPNELSVISVIEGVGASMLRTPLSCVRTEYAPLGHAAAQAMLATLDGAPLSDIVVRDCTSWIERASTGPVSR